MTPEKIVSVVERYRREFEEQGIPKQQMDIDKTFGDALPRELLAHAHYLLDGIITYAHHPEKQRKAGSHLSSVQMILSFLNWYTLRELMEHNRPDES